MHSRLSLQDVGDDTIDIDEASPDLSWCQPSQSADIFQTRKAVVERPFTRIKRRVRSPDNLAVDTTSPELDWCQPTSLGSLTEFKRKVGSIGRPFKRRSAKFSAPAHSGGPILTDIGDDLLRHVLSFCASKELARSSMVSVSLQAASFTIARQILAASSSSTAVIDENISTRNFFHLRQVAALESEIEQHFEHFNASHLQHFGWEKQEDQEDLSAFCGFFSLRAFFSDTDFFDPKLYNMSDNQTYREFHSVKKSAGTKNWCLVQLELNSHGVDAGVDLQVLRSTGSSIIVDESVDAAELMLGSLPVIILQNYMDVVPATIQYFEKINWFGTWTNDEAGHQRIVNFIVKSYGRCPANADQNLFVCIMLV
jgi:hypothetical protein